MPYTSPSPSLVSANGQQTTWWIPATNFGTQIGSGVNITITFSPAASLQLVTYVAPSGTSFSPNTGIWNVGTLAPGASNTKWLKIVTSVADIGMAPFTLTSVISGNGIDPNNVNNTKVQTLNSTVENAVAGAINDPNSCNCVDVSVNDTPCSHGVTEWRITPGSITNSTTNSFDVTTGQGNFSYDDPTQDITFTYSIWCDTGSGFVQTSGPATVTINKLIENINAFNHTISTVPYSSLSPSDIGVLSAQYPSLVLSEYCWRVLRNPAGEATSGEPVDCDEAIDTRTFFFCSDVPCTVPEDPCPCPTDLLPIDITTQLPVGYVAEKGDTAVVYHTNAMSIWTFDGNLWNKWSCGCIYKISQDANNDLTLGSDNAPYFDLSSMTEIIELQDKVVTNIAFTGTTTKTLTLTFDDGTTLTANFLDLSAASNTHVQVSDTCSINMSISGTGSVGDPYVISANYNEGSPVYAYDSGVVGSTSNTLNVTTLFDVSCPEDCAVIYTLNGYSTDVFENVTLIGTTLTYDIKSTAPSGTHYINVERECAGAIL